MTGPFAIRLFRITFTLAGCYNLAFGVWAGFYPLAFFEIFEIEPPRYPAIWACIGLLRHESVLDCIAMHVAQAREIRFLKSQSGVPVTKPHLATLRIVKCVDLPARRRMEFLKKSL